jgi:integrase
MPKGIARRHSKHCTKRPVCECPDSYEPWVWDPRAGRKRRGPLTPRLSVAKAWRRDALADVARGEIRTPRTTPRLAVALDALIDAMRAETALTRSGTPYAAGTIRTYETAVRKVWKPQLGHLRIHEIVRADAQGVVDLMRADPKRGASYVHGSCDPMRVLYRRAIRAGLVTLNPMDNLELPAIRRKTIDVSAVEDPEAVLAIVPEGDRALWAASLYSTLRRGELRALRWDDIDLNRGVIHVSRSWDDYEGAKPTKTEAGERDDLLVAELRAELIRHKLATGRSGSALVFGRTETVPFATSSVWTRAVKAFDAAGIPRARLHLGRHGTITTMIGAGFDANAVKQYAGHSSIVTTYDVYGHLFPKSIDSDRAKLEAHRSRAPLARQSETDSAEADGS